MLAIIFEFFVWSLQCRDVNFFGSDIHCLCWFEPGFAPQLVKPMSRVDDGYWYSILLIIDADLCHRRAVEFNTFRNFGLCFERASMIKFCEQIVRNMGLAWTQQESSVAGKVITERN